MSNLARYLEIADAGPSKRKELVERYVPKELTTYDHDGKIYRARELLLTEGIEGSTLVQSEMYRTVVEGAEPQKCFRNVIPSVKMTSNSMTVPLGETGSYASEVGEGAEIPLATQDYGSRTLSVKKYGVRPVITKEMIEDSQFGLVELEARKAGYKIENTFNQKWLTTLLDNAGNEHDTAGSNQGIKAVAAAIALNKIDGFESTHLIVSPGMEGSVLGEFVPNSYYGTQDVMAGRWPEMCGLKVDVCGATDASATYTWAYAADSNIGGLVIDAYNAGLTGMRRDLTIEEYDDPIHDLKGMSVTMRFAYSYLHANAICRIEY